MNQNRAYELTIREMAPADQSEVLTVARSLAAWFRPLDQMALAIDMRQHFGLVAIMEGRLIGFMTYHLLTGQRAELSWFGVMPEYQGHGIGREMMLELEKRLGEMGAEVVQLSTVPADHDPTFAATNHFYHRQGFTVRQRDENFYAHGRPRILLEKQLA